MILNRATTEDYDSIIAYYDDVTDRTPDMELYARWQKGKHPTHDGIRAYIEEGSMYLYGSNGSNSLNGLSGLSGLSGGIVGAMALTMYQGEEYHDIEWLQQVSDDDVAVIHILAVSPDEQGKGIGSEMIREAIRLAQANGKKAIRLDALASNTPAHRIYERLGFEYRGKQHLYAENTGWTDFYFFEYRPD
jgi:ribosomal protein S18 acetylase RimI-like enzyme